MLKIYSTTVCPKCKELKNLCTEKGILYEDVDVTSDFKAKAKLTSKGIRTVPVIDLDGELVYGDLDFLKNKIVDI